MDGIDLNEVALSANGQAALAYVWKGLHVHPLCWPTAEGLCGCGKKHVVKEAGKAPLTEHGFKDATTYPEQSTTWWRRWPLANIGVALAPSGLVVLDCDSPAALEEARRLSEPEGLPHVPSVRSGRPEGGWHLYFPRPAICPRERIKGFGESRSVDILSDGYVVLPPSRHRSGRAYAWEVRLNG